MSEKIKIRVGNQSSFSAKPILRPFEYAAAQGFDAFEWFPDKKISGEGWAEEDVSKETRSLIRETALSKGIALSVHMSSQTDPLKAGAYDAFAKDIRFARDIGAVLFNIHFYPTVRIEAYVESILPLIDLLAPSGIRLSIENTPEMTPHDFNRLFGYLGSMDSSYVSNVGMCLDVGHANLCNSTRNDYLRYVDLLDAGVPVIHMHMHENYGDYDSHLPIFTGPAKNDPSGIKGLMERLKKRGFSGSIILEQWPQPPGLLDEARNRLLAMIGYTFVKGGPEGFRPSRSDKPIRKRALAGGVSRNGYRIVEDDFVKALSEANQQLLSWRKKLEWVRGLLDKKRELDIEGLVYIAIYMRFIGTGEVRCSEDGGHYRPSNHARISQGIYKRLSGMATADNILIIRKIYPWLPSFAGTFMRAEPLTLIRDIAHRNDIPQELKREIKLSLQNKLHRSAGPEDLATSESLLKRITAPGVSYSPAFVGEFKRFHEELKAFFNVHSLDEQLTALMEQGVEDRDLVRAFLQSKETAEKPEQLLDTFKLLTELRSYLWAKLKGNQTAEGHHLQLIDIGLEDFSFVLLSRLINYFAATENDGCGLMLSSMSLSIRNLRLSGLDVEECVALESELKAWTERFNKEDRDQLLRLKASIDRCRRLAEGYCDRILALFPERVERLGRSLGVAEYAIEVFAEADIRGHPVFQLSKLVTLLLKKIRTLASLSPWDVIVPGTVSGSVTAASKMNNLAVLQSGPIIALLDDIEGDEEVPDRVAGIIVAHETPILSHLAVRARQRKIVFAACDERNLFSELEAFTGKMGVLHVSTERLDLKPARKEEGEGVYSSDAREIQKCTSYPLIDLSVKAGLLSLDQVTPAAAGNKALGAGRLEELSSRSGPGFKTPPGVVIPFGVMEESLRSSPSLEKEYRERIDSLNGLAGNDFDEALRRLKEIVGRLHVPVKIISAVIKRFGENERLMVRSSSSCEDGEGFSGAGVYDSVANVPPSSLAEAVRAVWASLWNYGAVMTRKNAGIPHNRAYMAVLIQSMLYPEYSFIMHTVNPVDRKQAEVYIELAVGLGETLASAETPGVPYRMVFDKDTKKVRMLAFSSFSTSARPDPKRGTVRKIVDYSHVDFSRDETFRDRLGIRLGRIGTSVENACGCPQDIEGLISGDVIYLVQSRPQQGLK